MRRRSWRHSAAANPGSLLSLVHFVSGPNSWTASAKVGVVPVRHDPIVCDSTPTRMTLDPPATAHGTIAPATASKATVPLPQAR
jgi:hypothetical protein